MKLSTLIKKLAIQLEEHGDKDAVVAAFGSGLDVLDVFYSEGSLCGDIVVIDTDSE